MLDDYSEAHAAGYDIGFENGLDEGRDEGYHDGYDDGYTDSKHDIMCKLVERFGLQPDNYKTIDQILDALVLKNETKS